MESLPLGGGQRTCVSNRGLFVGGSGLGGFGAGTGVSVLLVGRTAVEVLPVIRRSGGGVATDFAAGPGVLALAVLGFFYI